MYKPLLYIDFETQSEVNIKASGSYRYVQGMDFRPVCMAYSINDHPEIPLWTLDQEFPTDLLRNSTLVAYNIEFEYNVLKSKWFSRHGYDMAWLTHDHFIDVQAVARLFGFPAKLEELAKVLGVKHQKDAKGTKLINLLCKVKNHKPLNYEDAPSKFQDLFDYCKQDIRTTRACHEALIKDDLSEREREVFHHMLEQNDHGFPIDIKSVRRIAKVMERYKARCNDKIYNLTGGIVTAGTQTQRIGAYIRQWYPEVKSIAAPIIEDVLENQKLNQHCRDLMYLRQQVSHSSTAKYQRILDMIEDDNHVRGNLKYYGGHTGRFAGVGVQVHNLPRAQVDDPDKYIRDFFDLDIDALIEKHGNIGSLASKLIRPMIKAPESYNLCVADYISIENVVLHWTANDQDTMEDFRQEKDQYKTYAARRFHVQYNEVTDKQRAYAKPCVLGLGFGGGGAALQRVAAGHGVIVDDFSAEEDKKFYRATFPMIPDLWYTVSSYLINATKRGTTLELNTGTTTLRFIGRRGYSFIVLPSGRFLAYPQPQIQRDAQYDRPCFTYMGIDGKTHKWRRLGDQHRIIAGKRIPDMPVHGGRLVENIVQALARDILVHGMLNVKHDGFKCIGSVHDEALAVIPGDATGSTLEEFCLSLCRLPVWAKGMPMRAEGYIGERYRKG